MVKEMDRRTFLALGVLTLAGACAPSTSNDQDPATTGVTGGTSGTSGATGPRLLYSRGAASPVGWNACQDAALLLSPWIADLQAASAAEADPATAEDVWIGVLGDAGPVAERAEYAPPAGLAAGGFQISAGVAGDPRVVIMGVDEEGARNGVYTWLERLGFGFFRDGDQAPEAIPDDLGASLLPIAEAPAFALRGEMFWDAYLGPRRFCAATWGLAEWERALRFLARRRMNFVEFYPPIEQVTALAMPEVGAVSGRAWAATEHHALAKAVLQRGRALGIRFMYVLTYGRFIGGVARAYPALNWSGPFLCPEGPELKELTERVWRTLIEEFGTDHLYALRHRGEEGQVYSNPCRSLTKAEGMRQALEVFDAIDPGARVTVWTWSEDVPTLFAELPPRVEAAHIRHGLGDVFSNTPEGREQSDGAARDMPAPRPWLSAQFTVFGGYEALLQTAWCDPEAIARDARVSARDPLCGGFFHWPEWTGTSPWLSHALAELSWDPDAFATDAALRRYAELRHGPLAEAFLAGFAPLVALGNAPYMFTPNKRLVLPYRQETAQHAAQEATLAGLDAMAEALPEGAPLFARDLVDLTTLVSVRAVQAWELEACLRVVADDTAGALEAADAALATWDALRDLLAAVPELSVLETARAMAREGAVDTLQRRLVTDLTFFDGYAMVWSAETIERVYRVQTARLRAEIEQLNGGYLPTLLRGAGWFWRDFPDDAWTVATKRLPGAIDDLPAFEAELELAVGAAITQGQAEGSDAPLADRERLLEGLITPHTPTAPPRDLLRGCVTGLTQRGLPPALVEAPSWS